MLNYKYRTQKTAHPDVMMCTVYVELKDGRKVSKAYRYNTRLESDNEGLRKQCELVIKRTIEKYELVVA